MLIVATRRRGLGAILQPCSRCQLLSAIDIATRTSSPGSGWSDNSGGSRSASGATTDGPGAGNDNRSGGSSGSSGSGGAAVRLLRPTEVYLNRVAAGEITEDPHQRTVRENCACLPACLPACLTA